MHINKIANINCTHTNHLFAAPLCKNQTRARKIANVALHILTFFIPLAFYHIYSCYYSKRASPTDKTAIYKEKIDLQKVKITKAIVECFDQHTTVTEIDLSGAKNVTTELLCKLSELPNLSSLKLTNCGLTKQHVEKLITFVLLTELDVSGNELSPEDLTTLEEWASANNVTLIC